MVQGYFFAGESPEELDLRRKLATAMLARGTQPQRIDHWTQGTAKLLDALQGRMELDSAGRAEKKARADASASAAPIIENLFASPSPASAPPLSDAAPAASPASDVTPTFDAKMLRTDYQGPAYYPPAADREKVWREAAEKKGLNGDEIIKLLRGENLNDSGDLQSNFRNAAGVREPSFGDSQLLIGGEGTGYGKGLGNEALAAGIDPRDPSQFRKVVDFTVDKMASSGIGPWMAAPKVGVTDASIRRPPGLAGLQTASNQPMRIGAPDAPQVPPSAATPAGGTELPWLTGGGARSDVGGIVRALQNPHLDPGSRAMLMEALKLRMPQAMKWTEIGTDSMGKKTYGFVDEKNQKVFGPTGSPIDPSSQQQVAGAADDLTGEDYLKASGLSENEKTTVRALAEYKYDPRYLAVRGNQRQKLFEHAMRLNPDLNVANYQNVFALNKEFRGGKYSQSMRAADQIIHHLGSLKGSFDKLNKRSVPLIGEGPFNEGDLGPLTSFANKKRGEYLEGEGAAEINEVRANAKAVANELGKLFKGAGATSLQDIQEWEELISSDLTPEQQDAVIKKAIELMSGGIASYRNIYDNGMGPAYVATRPFESVFKLDKHSAEVLHKFGLNENDLGLVSPNGPNFEKASHGAPAAPPTTKGVKDMTDDELMRFLNAQ